MSRCSGCQSYSIQSSWPASDTVMIKIASNNAPKINITFKTSETIPCLGLWVKSKAKYQTRRYEIFCGSGARSLSIPGVDAGISERK